MDLRVSEYSIYEKCLVAIESVLNKRFPDDKSVFYDGGKYFTRSLEYYDMTSFRVQTEVSASPTFFGWVFLFFL